MGKSTLFNALTEAAIEAQNYPFCTIDPNVGMVPVPDPRLDVIAAIVVLLSPGIIGRIAEESVESNLQWAADESKGFVVTSERFDRGWFSSQGRHRIEIRDPGMRDALATLAGRDPDLLLDQVQAVAIRQAHVSQTEIEILFVKPFPGLMKIAGGAARIPNEEAEENPASAHLFIVNPLHGGGLSGRIRKQVRQFGAGPHPAACGIKKRIPDPDIFRNRLPATGASRQMTRSPSKKDRWKSCYLYLGSSC